MVRLLSLAAAALQYAFTEGEPLDYRLTINGQIESTLTRVMGEKRQTEPHKQQVEITVDCRFVPIAFEADGVTKLRLVLDRIEQKLNDDGELAVTTLTRSVFKRERGGQVTEQAYFDIESAPDAPNVKSVSASELFDEPILLCVARDGAIREFDDRSLLGKVLPTLDLRRCLELILVQLPAEESDSWSARRPVDSPRDRKLPESVQLPVLYTRRGSTVRFEGSARFDPLHVLIDQFEEKWLVWTTSLEAVADSLRGEVEFDGGAIKRAALRSHYRAKMRSARREDKGRRYVDETLESELTIQFEQTSSTPATSGMVVSERR